MPKTGKKRRKGVVTAPDLQDLYTPPSSSKKPRPSKDITSGLEVSSAPSSPSSWDVQQVSGFLRGHGIKEEVVKIFEEHEIQGRHLCTLTQQDIKDMGIKALGTQKDLMSLIRTLKPQTLRLEKVFNDPIHGHIELHSLMVKIIDTPQFQRLRYIKQLGGGYHVFPGASHNRFEHSIGVGFLAGELVETLKRKQPELEITDKDVLCVKVAGLCHDLGHGPFSHLFDGKFIPQIRPGLQWQHEKASVMMFEHLLEVNGLRPVFDEYGLGETDIKFIKEQIAGPLESEMQSQVDGEWPYQGRPMSKSFLYEIVANKRNGIDVDKWDYFARDCHCLGIPNNFDLHRFMKFARVIVVNDRRQICTRDKEVHNLYEMFHTRSSLHRRAYQHKTAKIIENMLTEALVKANKYFLIPGENGDAKRMSEAIYDPFAYTRLTDHVVQQILMSDDPMLEESRKLLQKIEKRQLYKSIGQTQPSGGKKVTKEQAGSIARDIINSLSDEDRGSLPKLVEDDLLVDVVTFDYGMKDENPIDHMRFYVKEQPHKAVKVRKDQVSQMLPEKFMEQHIRVYCKRSDQDSLKSARKYFIAWCTRENCVTPKADVFDENESDPDMDTFTPYSTPMKAQSDSGGHNECGVSRTPLSSTEVVKKLQFTVD